MTGTFDSAFVQSVVEHMNHDHADAVLNCVRAFAPAVAGQQHTRWRIYQARMTDIDASGFATEITLVSGEVQHLVIAYAAAGLPPQLERPEQVRSALVTMAKKARLLLNDEPRT